MLPKHYYKDEIFDGHYSDRKWIESQIDLLPIAMQKTVAERYSDIYLKLSIEDPKLCRRRSNTWLRLTVDKNKVIHTDNGVIF